MASANTRSCQSARRACKARNMLAGARQPNADGSPNRTWLCCHSGVAEEPGLGVIAFSLVTQTLSGNPQGGNAINRSAAVSNALDVSRSL
jgi:hypothetical protein